MRSALFKGILSLVITSSPHTVYNSLDPYSVAQQFAFYQLYPDTEEGKKALERAWQLLSKGRVESLPLRALPSFDLQAIICLVTRQPFDSPVALEEEQLEAIDQLASHFANRTLKGARVWSKEEVIALPSEEIDLARGLLLEQIEEPGKIRQYEAAIDLMALQIRARLSSSSSAEEKIRAINRFIFQEMQFRFPPHSLYAEDVDLYTFLPSVLDSRLGVCLGVSILYLCIAQRLDLPLEIITPPGHIYLRYCNEGKKINIETTARGIHMPDEVYLAINTRKLQERTLKEVIGMAFINEASVHLGRQQFAKMAELYEKARPYVPNDPLLDLLQGLSYLFVGKKSAGKNLLKKVEGEVFDHAVSAETMPEDYLKGRVDIEGLKMLFLPVDETRESILAKQKKLQKTLERYPRFRAGILQLATTWLQLARLYEAQEVLERYHLLDPKEATVEYYLALIALERSDYNRAWAFLESVEQLTAQRDHHPRALRELRRHLSRLSPK